eukprot:3812057-Pyramimonas_sp.AAC.1
MSACKAIPALNDIYSTLERRRQADWFLFPSNADASVGRLTLFSARPGRTHPKCTGEAAPQSCCAFTRW